MIDWGRGSPLTCSEKSRETEDKERPWKQSRASRGYFCKA